MIKASEPSPHKLPSGTVAGSTTPGADPAGPVISASEPSPHRLPSGTVAGSTTPGIDPAGPVISASEPPGKDDQISLLVMMGGGTSKDCPGEAELRQNTSATCHMTACGQRAKSPAVQLHSIRQTLTCRWQMSPNIVAEARKPK